MRITNISRGNLVFTSASGEAAELAPGETKLIDVVSDEPRFAAAIFAGLVIVDEVAADADVSELPPPARPTRKAKNFGDAE